MRGRLAIVAAVVALGLGACGGSDSSGDAPSPAGEPLFGFNGVVPGGEANMLLANSGAEFIRTSITWARVEHSPGKRDFAPFDAIAEQLEADGLRPFWVLSGAPCWAAAQACTEEQPHRAPAPAHDDDFARFAVEVAKRYPDAVGLEIWNEPNIPNFWEPEPDAGRYRELLATTAEAVHASGSEVPVVMAGPSPTTDAIAADDPRKIPFADFTEEVMKGPDPPDVDAIGVHPYSLLQVGPDPADETLRLYEQARAAAERAAPGVPIWITEVGLTTAGRRAVSPDGQAGGLRRIIAAAEADEVPVITIHRFLDQSDPVFEFDAGFGVVAADLTPKPAFCVVPEAVGIDCEA